MPRFSPLAPYFAMETSQLRQTIDDLAERSQALRGYL